MCDLTEVQYMPGDIVWVKLGSCWWPGEVKDMETLPEEIMSALKKKPLAVVKFFGEDSYEYVKTLDSIYHYNNRRKLEFIKKGMELTRSKSKQGSSLMDKFPTDVVTAESLTKGDINILSTVAFVPEERPQYKDLFGDPKKKSPKKNGAGRPSIESKFSSDRKPGNSLLGKMKPLIQLKQRITHPRFTNASDHEVRIRQQPKVATVQDVETVNHPYKCQQCDFGTSRQNVFILHCKAHRDNIIKPGTSSKTPSTAPSKNKRTPKSTLSRKVTLPKSAPAATVTSKEKKLTPRDNSVSAARRKIFQSGKKSAKKGGDKEVQSVSPVKPKSDEVKERDREKRNTILADWDEEDEEEEEKEFKRLKLEVDEKEKDETPPVKKSIATSVTKGDTPVAATPSSDPSSIYDLIEDAEEFVPLPRLSESKRMIPEPAAIPTESADTREIDDEVANLLEETAVPTLPQVPSLNKTSSNPESDKLHHTRDIPEESSSQTTSAEKESTVRVPSSEPSLDRINGVLKDSTATSVSVAASIPSEVVTNPASTLSTVISPSASKTNSNGATLVQSQSSTETTEDPNAETATYVLVTIDESGGFQQFQTLEGMGNTTLLAYDSSQGEEGGTRTLYIDPSQLGGSASGLENLFLAIDASDGSGTSMVQLQQQVALQVGEDSNSVVTSEELNKSKQDILAVALANTQVLQSSPLEAGVGNDAVVKVTNAAQSPVMTPRVAESQVTPQNKVTPSNNETTGAIANTGGTGALR